MGCPAVILYLSMSAYRASSENTRPGKPGAFISLSKAAEMLSISVPTLRRRIAAGELPASCRPSAAVDASSGSE
jgi:hypothetical protein